MHALADLPPRRRHDKLHNVELLNESAHFRNCEKPIALCDKCLPTYMKRIEEARDYSDM